MENKLKAPFLLAAACLAFHLFAGFSFIRSAAPTYDETVHLASGYSYLATGRYAMNIMDHPPFSEMLSALPLLALKPQVFSGHPYFANLMPYSYGDLFLYHNTVPPERLLNTARGFTFLVWTALLAGLLWLLLSRLESPAAAAFALCAFAGMPVFISNDALVSTDAAAAVFYFASFVLGWLFTAETPAGGKAGKGGRLWLWAALAGAAFCAKELLFLPAASPEQKKYTVALLLFSLGALSGKNFKSAISPGRAAALALAAVLIPFLPLINYRVAERAWGNYGGEKASWLELQRWARENTPVQAVFLVPPDTYGFRVFSLRSPVTEWLDGGAMHWAPGFEKDWAQRIADLRAESPRPEGADLGYSAINEAGFIRLGRKNGASYAVRRSGAALAFKTLYSNPDFTLYALPRP